MKKPGRNDPCPCGSGKKYKQCCLQAEAAQAATAGGDRSDAVPKAIHWLMQGHGRAVREALDEMFFGTLDDDEYEMLRKEHADSFEGILVNAMEWLLADGEIRIGRQSHRVAELVQGRGGPLLSEEQRQWLALLAAHPLGLYEVVDLVPGESLQLKDVLFPGHGPVWVSEKAGSRNTAKFDLLAARLLPVGDHFELSGAVYPIPRHRGLDLIAELRNELEGVAPGTPDAREIVGVLVRDCWLRLFVSPFEMPQIVDLTTGEPILLITDHYRVKDWDALTQALAGEADVEGNRKEGWDRLFEGQDGQLRRRLGIDPGQKPERIKVSYSTPKYADEGRPWFEAVAAGAVVFLSREISDPKGLLATRQPSGAQQAPTPAQLPPGVLAEMIGQKIHQFYAHWADEPLPALGGRTPREAIKTAEGLEQVKFLLHSYEHGEARQAKDQQRPQVSYDFLWQALGISP